MINCIEWVKRPKTTSLKMNKIQGVRSKKDMILTDLSGSILICAWGEWIEATLATTGIAHLEPLSAESIARECTESHLSVGFWRGTKRHLDSLRFYISRLFHIADNSESDIKEPRELRVCNNFVWSSDWYQGEICAVHKIFSLPFCFNCHFSFSVMHRFCLACSTNSLLIPN